MNIKFLEYNGDWDRDVKDDNGNIIEEVNWFYHKILLDGEEIDYYVWRSEYFDEDGDSKGDDIHIYVTGGILEIQPNRVVVLADSALHAKDLDADAAKKARDEARKAIDGASQDLDLVQAQANLVEAEARYKAAQRLKGR